MKVLSTFARVVKLAQKGTEIGRTWVCCPSSTKGSLTNKYVAVSLSFLYFLVDKQQRKQFSPIELFSTVTFVERTD